MCTSSPWMPIIAKRDAGPVDPGGASTDLGAKRPSPIDPGSVSRELTPEEAARREAARLNAAAGGTPEQAAFAARADEARQRQNADNAYAGAGQISNQLAEDARQRQNADAFRNAISDSLNPRDEAADAQQAHIQNRNDVLRAGAAAGAPVAPTKQFGANPRQKAAAALRVNSAQVGNTGSSAGSSRLVE